MKVLHLSFSDQIGGAARCAYRIHRALCQHTDDVSSQMLVVKKLTEDDSVTTLTGVFAQRVRSIKGLIDRKVAKILASHDDYPVHSLNLLPSGLLNEISKISPDIIHIHWVSGAMISIQEIASLSIPIVWTLHDLWPVLGSRHHPESVISSQIFNENGCYVVSKNRVSRWLYRYKAKRWADLNMSFVSQCEWSHKIAESSLVGYGHKHDVIGCPLDIKIFKPIDRRVARRELGLAEDEHLLMVGGSGALSPKNQAKGFQYFFEAIQKLSDLNLDINIRIITIGADQDAPEMPFPVTSFGYIKDSSRLALLYSSVDVVVVPSVMETFGQSISESMACGTPVVAFDVTSQKDLVEDGVTGYLVDFPDTDDFALQMKAGLLKGANMRQACRVRAVNRWGAASICKLYRDVYFLAIK